MSAVGTLLYWIQSNNGQYSEPHKSSPLHSLFFKLNFNTAFPSMLVPLILHLTLKFFNWNGACVCYFTLASSKLLPTRCKIPGDQNPKYPNSANFKSLITSTYARTLALCGKSFKLIFFTPNDEFLSVISTNFVISIV